MYERCSRYRDNVSEPQNYRATEPQRHITSELHSHRAPEQQGLRTTEPDLGSEQSNLHKLSIRFPIYAIFLAGLIDF